MIIEVIWFSFKSVLLWISVLNWVRLFISYFRCVKCVEGLAFNCTLRLIKVVFWLIPGLAMSCHRRVCLSAVIGTTWHDGQIVNTAHVRHIQSSLFGFVISQLIVHCCISTFNFSNLLVVLLELLSGEILNSYVGWGNLSMHGALGRQPLFFLIHLLVIVSGLLLIDQAWEDFGANHPS